MGRVGRRAAALAALIGALAAPAAAAGQDGAPPTPRVAAFTAPASVPYGAPVRVAGRVAPAAPATVRIERLEGGAWRPLRTVRAGADGRFAAGMPLRRSAGLRAAVVGPDGTLTPGRRRFVGIVRRVALRVTARPYEAIAGRPLLATGAVVPAAPGERVVIEGAVGGGPFRPLARARVRDGRVRATVRVPSGGRWRLRLVAAPRPGRDRGGAAAAALSIHGPNPHGVPASAPRYLVQSVSQTLLYYYERGRLTRVFPVVMGKPSTPTPLGSYRVYSRTAGPSPAFGPRVLWYHRGYGIHGTNQEHLLSRSWRYYSAGCTRNYNANILWLWDRVPVGTPVRNVA